MVLLSLIAVCLGLRLVFEETLFSYYFMALMVALVLVDVARGHIRFPTVAWITVVSFVFGVMSPYVRIFYDHGWSEDARNVTAVVIIVLALLLLARNMLRRRTSDALVCVAVLVATLLAWDVSANPFGYDLPVWFWQIGAGLVRPGPSGETAGARSHGLRYALRFGSRTRSRPGRFEWTGGRIRGSGVVPCCSVGSARCRRRSVTILWWTVGAALARQPWRP